MIPGSFDFTHDIRRNMKSVLQPWQLLLLILAGWINRHQQDVFEYLRHAAVLLAPRGLIPFPTSMTSCD